MKGITTEDEAWLTARLESLAEQRTAFVGVDADDITDPSTPHRAQRRGVLVVGLVLLVALAATGAAVALWPSAATDEGTTTSGGPTSVANPDPTVSSTSAPRSEASRADAFAAQMLSQLDPSYSVASAKKTGDGDSASLSLELLSSTGARLTIITSPAYPGAPAVIARSLYKSEPAPDGLLALSTTSGISINVVVNEPATGYDVSFVASPDSGLTIGQLVELGAEIVAHKP